MMQYSAPEDWVLATGESHKVREFVEKAFLVVDLNWEKYVEISEKYFLGQMKLIIYSAMLLKQKNI